MYNFIELEKAALENRFNAEAVSALAEWYERYGSEFWNGEAYFGNFNGQEYRLKPIYAEEPNEDDGFDIIKWELD